MALVMGPLKLLSHIMKTSKLHFILLGGITIFLLYRISKALDFPRRAK